MADEKKGWGLAKAISSDLQESDVEKQHRDYTKAQQTALDKMLELRMLKRLGNSFQKLKVVQGSEDDDEQARIDEHQRLKWLEGQLGKKSIRSSQKEEHVVAK
eukprot:evm.model.scf_151.1 EVM.evm.TU.scf_151.1   scf_151:27406-28780(-)